MKQNTIFSFNTLTTIVIAITLAVLGSWFLYNVSPVSKTINVSAGTTDNLSGWAWSSGGIWKDVGNVVVNCDDQGGISNGAVDVDCGGDNSTPFSTNSYGATLTGAGWISFNCTNTNSCGTSNYGVHINTSQKFISGGKDGFYDNSSAWIGNFDNSALPLPTGTFGWLSFDRSKTGNPPPTETDPGAIISGSPLAYIDWSDGKIYGWARILSGCQDVAGSPPSSCTSRGTYNALCPVTGGQPIPTWAPGVVNDACGSVADSWDGWVKLAGLATNGSSYGVALNSVTNMLTGYAWGGTGVGWIDFSAGGTGDGIKFAPGVLPQPGICGSANGTITAIQPADSTLCDDTSVPSAPYNVQQSASTPYKWNWSCDSGTTLCSAFFPQCSDGIDNDGDGKIDRDAGNEDPGCSNGADNSERSF